MLFACFPPWKKVVPCQWPFHLIPGVKTIWKSGFICLCMLPGSGVKMFLPLAWTSIQYATKQTLWAISWPWQHEINWNYTNYFIILKYFFPTGGNRLPYMRLWHHLLCAVKREAPMGEAALPSPVGEAWTWAVRWELLPPLTLIVLGAYKIKIRIK